MSLSDSSALSSPPSTDDEDSSLQTIKKDGMLKFISRDGAHGSATRADDPPPQKKRPASPPHEYVLADSPDIAVSLLCSNRVNVCCRCMWRVAVAVANTGGASSSSCSARASAKSFPSHSHTMDRKTLRRAWSTQRLGSMWRIYFVHYLASF